MVLQPNFAKRNASNMENTPPSVLPKSLTSRLLSQRRRARVGNSNQYAAEQAALRSRRRKRSTKQFNFKLRALPTPDTEMSDATSACSFSNTVNVALPRDLPRPEYQEVTREALFGCSSAFTDVPAAYLREMLEPLGPYALKSLASVRTEPVLPTTIPSEVEVKLEHPDDFSPLNPSHMLAVYGPAPTSASSTPASKRKVTLYPVHSHFLAMHCSRLPPFHPVEETIVKAGTPFKIPVRTLCLPSPSNYARLSTYLYTRKADTLLSSLMPSPPPLGILTPLPSSEGISSEPLSSDEHRKLVKTYAYQIARRYTTQIILQHSTVVYGLWQNTCALGIFDDRLWEVLDVAWQVLLVAIAVGTGSSIDSILGEEESA